MAAVTKAAALLYCLFRRAAALLATHSTCTYIPINGNCEPVSPGSRQASTLPFSSRLCANTRLLFLLTKDGKESMCIRDVTFEELLAMLRRPPELVAKKTAAENSDRDKTGVNLNTPQSR
jgi:hypothetical protein